MNASHSYYFVIRTQIYCSCIFQEYNKPSLTMVMVPFSWLLKLIPNYVPLTNIALPPCHTMSALGNYHSTLCLHQLFKFHIFGIMWHLSFCAWLSSLNILQVHLCVRNDGISSFHSQIVFHCICIPHFLHQVLKWQTLCLIKDLSYYK